MGLMKRLSPTDHPQDAIATQRVIDIGAPVGAAALALLQAAQLSGFCALVLNAGSDDLAIINRNAHAGALFPEAPASLLDASRITHMTFADIRSHVMVVAASGDAHHGDIVLAGDHLAGDHLAGPRRITILKVQPDDESDSTVILIVGDRAGQMKHIVDV